MDGLTPLTEMPADTIGHSHVFLGGGHDRSERRTWWVIALCAAMMVLEIVGGLAFGSIALALGPPSLLRHGRRFGGRLGLTLGLFLRHERLPPGTDDLRRTTHYKVYPT